MIVAESKWVFSLGGGMVTLFLWTQVSTTLGDFVTMWLIRGCEFGPLEASAPGHETTSLEGKVR